MHQNKIWDFLSQYQRDGLGLKFEGRAHRGVDDAVMAAKMLWEVIKS